MEPENHLFNTVSKIIIQTFIFGFQPLVFRGVLLMLHTSGEQKYEPGESSEFLAI